MERAAKEALGKYIFYIDAHRQIFNIVVRQVWLEFQVTYDGKRRRRRKDGFRRDASYGWFIKSMVGISQKPIVNNRCFTAVATYLKDFFPDFLNNNPFKNPELYEYPFKHLTLDHLFFVYMCEDRIEMLEYADKKEMNILDFTNWATNHVLSYNEDIGHNKYYRP